MFLVGRRNLIVALLTGKVCFIPLTDRPHCGEIESQLQATPALITNSINTSPAPDISGKVISLTGEEGEKNLYNNNPVSTQTYRPQMCNKVNLLQLDWRTLRESRLYALIPTHFLKHFITLERYKAIHSTKILFTL